MKESDYPKRERLINSPEEMEYISQRLERLSGQKINMFDFIGVEKPDGNFITKEEVERDLKEARGFHQGEREENQKKFADLVEMAWVGAINLKLLGEDFRAVRTSEYDDSHGVDFLTIKDGGDKDDSYFGFAVDVSFSAEAIRKKLNGVERKIKQKRRRIGEPKPKYQYSYLYKIKYFADKNGIYRELSVPRVIVGMDYRGSESLIKGLAYADVERIIKEAYAHIRSLLEILWQTRHFYELAKKKGRAHTAIAYRDFYNNFLPLFQRYEKVLMKNRDTILSDRVISIFIDVLNLDREKLFEFHLIDEDDTLLGRKSLKNIKRKGEEK